MAILSRIEQRGNGLSVQLFQFVPFVIFFSFRKSPCSEPYNRCTAEQTERPEGRAFHGSLLAERTVPSDVGDSRIA